MRRRGPLSARDAPCTSLPQLTPEGLPLALARQAAEHTRMINAVAALEQRGEALTSRSLATEAHISREYRVHLAPAARNGGARRCSDVIRSAIYPYSTSDNIVPAGAAMHTAIAASTPAPGDPLWLCLHLQTFCRWRQPGLPHALARARRGPQVPGVRSVRRVRAGRMECTLQGKHALKTHPEADESSTTRQRRKLFPRGWGCHSDRCQQR